MVIVIFGVIFEVKMLEDNVLFKNCPVFVVMVGKTASWNHFLNHLGI